MNTITTPIQCKTIIKAPLSQVFAALSTSAGWDSWFTHGTVFECVPNSDILLSWKNWGPDSVTLQAKGKLLECIPERYLKFMWNYGLEGGPTTVEVFFSLKNHGTLVEIKESGYPQTQSGWEVFVECATGWGEALTLLKIYCEHGITYHD
jgi:uncharacterized protein YndB with AHSA1/START domain